MRWSFGEMEFVGVKGGIERNGQYLAEEEELKGSHIKHH